MFRLSRSCLVALLPLIGCTPSADQPRRLNIPCTLGDVRWGMIESELKLVRPEIHYSNSDERFHEQLDGCEPFITSASYDVGRWRGLTQIHLWGHMTVTSPDDFDSLIPGFLYGCRSMWGMPHEVEAFQRPRWGEDEYWHIGMSWDLPQVTVRASYSLPEALFPHGEEWSASIEVHISKPSFFTPASWTHGVRDPEKIDQFSRAFPSDDHAPEVVFN